MYGVTYYTGITWEGDAVLAISMGSMAIVAAVISIILAASQQ